MQYAIPQFIEVEDRVIGPLTIRQFLIMLAGALITGAGYGLFDFALFLFVGVIAMGIASLFAFLKINGMNLEKFLAAFISFQINPKMRLWAKEISMKHEVVKNVDKRQVILRSDLKETVTRSKLHDLSILLDASSRDYVERAGSTTESSSTGTGSTS